MSSFPSTLRGVFGARAGSDVSSPPNFLKAWSLFKRPTAAPAPRSSADLNRVVASEVIPRLMAAHRVQIDNCPVEDRADWPVTPKTLARRILLDWPGAQASLFKRLSNGKISPKAIYRDLLAPTASLMAELWRSDELSFADVTLGLGRLRTLIRKLGWMTPYNGDDEITPRTALFAPGPGEEPTFGFYLIEESFRWSGWKTVAEGASTNDRLVGIVQQHWFDFACLSLNHTEEIERTARAIRAIRRGSRNADIFVLVNGRAFVEQPEMIAILGAQAATSSGSAPLHIADMAVLPPTKQ
jgi:hypothetical protein